MDSDRSPSVGERPRGRHQVCTLLIATLALITGSCVCYPYRYCGREVVCLPPPVPIRPTPVVVTRVVHVHGAHCGHVFVHGAWVAER